MRWFGLLLLIGGAVAAFFAINLILWQDRAVRSFVPVDARVVQSSIRTHRSKNSTTYSPEVTYMYDVRGQSYTSTDVFPYADNGSWAWAKSITDRYPGHTDTTAYINPLDPSESVLIRQYSATPYFFTGLALEAAGFGFLMLIRVIGGARKTMQAILLDPAGGWQLLLPEKSVRKNLHDAILAFLFTGLPLALLLIHLFLRKWDLAFFGWIPVIAALILIVVQIMWAIRAWSVSRHMSDPRVLVNPAPLKRGDPFAIKIEFDAYSPLRVKTIEAKLACVEHYREKRGNKVQVGTRDKAVTPLHLPGPQDIPAGAVLEREGHWLVSTNEYPPSAPAAAKTYPFYTWEIRLNVNLEGAADYKGIFPLEAI